MRVFCLWCSRWLTGLDVCYVLVPGTCWNVGAAVCTHCCEHAHHGLPLARDRQPAPYSDTGAA